MKKLTEDQEFKSYMPPLSEDEYNQLENNIKKEGCREPIIVWEDTIIDGHNRYNICKENNIEFQTVEKQFDTKDQAKVWIIDNQKGRRNLTDGWKWELAQAKKELLREKGKEQLSESGKKHKGNQYTGVEPLSKIDKPPEKQPQSKHNTRKELSNELGWSSGKTAMADKVWREAEPETKEKVKNGDITFNQAYNKIKQEEKQKKIEQEQKQREVKEPKYKGYIYNEKASDFLKRFESHSVDLLLTDPPYSTDIEDLESFLDEWLADALSKIKGTGRAYICIGAY